MLTNFYLNMNAGFGLSRAFELSFGVTLRTFLTNAATYLVLLVILTYALIFAGDMLIAAKVTSHERQAAYVRELERVVDKCTSRMSITHPCVEIRELTAKGSEILRNTFVGGLPVA